MDELIQQINHENPDIENVLKNLKEKELILATNKIHFCSIFPFEECLLILSDSNSSKTTIAYLLYFIGYFALSESFFPIELFERDDVISLLFSFLTANQMIRNQCVHVFQNIIQKSSKYIKFLLENDILTFIIETKPYFRIIDILTQIFDYYLNHEEEMENCPFTEQNIELLLHIFEIYFSTNKPKEMSYSLKYFRYLLTFYNIKYPDNNNEEEEGNPVNTYLISYLKEKIHLNQLLLSSNKEITDQAGLLLEFLPNPSIEYVRILIDSYSHHELSLEIVFKILLKNIDEWGGFDKDIIIEFIRNSIPTSSFQIAKFGAQIYLKLYNVNDEFDIDIIRTLSRFASEEDLTFQIFQLFLEINDAIQSKQNSSSEDEISEFHEIAQDLLEIAEESLLSQDQNISAISLQFIKTFENIT